MSFILRRMKTGCVKEITQPVAKTRVPPGTRTRDRIQQTQERSGFSAVTFILYPKLYPDILEILEEQDIICLS